MARRICIAAAILGLLVLISCGGSVTPQTGLLTDAKKDFKSSLKNEKSNMPLEQPPADVFSIVHYDSPVGSLPAYVTPDPGDGQKHPAIVWITGGDCNSIGDVWSPVDPSDDQTAAAFRQAGIVMMFPSLRGGNQNPGVKEGFLGEVDDVIAAADYLAKQEHVDPQRIYLGGHSTGGTLVLLVAESTDRFRAIFSFGPVEDVSGYGLGSEYLPFNSSDPKEILVRSPLGWLHNIKSPTFVLEGGGDGNISSLEAMRRASKNSQVHFIAVGATDHFGILAPTNKLLAQKVLADTGPTSNLTVTEQEVNALFGR
jgi:dipeptidyl aminopeptidase/acylaminoacyl peptidase